MGVILESAGANIMDKVVGVVPSILNLATTCFNAVVENPITLIYLGVGFVGVGFGIFGMMRKSARGR